jgi:hypothetical protein
MREDLAGAGHIAKRLVLLFPGFEPLDADTHYRRFQRGAAETAKVYGTAIETGPAERTGDLLSFGIVSEATQTEFVICDLLPVMETMSGHSLVVRMARGLKAQAGFILNGTLFSYLRTSWRYGLFFLYSLLMLAAIIAAAWVVYGVGGAVPTLIALGALLWLACRHAHFLLMMDLWRYAEMLAKDSTGHELEATRELVAAAERAVLDRTGVDEIIVAGHSIGAALAVELADRLREGKAVTPVHVLTLGSGLLQIALHPKGGRYREMAKRLLGNGTYWLDVQALIDPINFLHSNLDRKYVIVAPNYREIIIRMRHLLNEGTYRRIKFNFFRVHRQFVLPVERSQAYSFHKIVSGRTPFPAIVRTGGLPESEYMQGAVNADVPV